MDINHLPTQLENRAQVYCITRGGGYVRSWLIKTLLENGYTVHATLRDPSKNTFLRSLPRAQDRIHLFTKDLCEEGNFDSASHGCHGMFHVATPMVFSECKDPEKEIVKVIVQGTLNILKSCKKAESMRRVVFTSSSAMPFGKSVVVIDESCWTSLDIISKISSQGRFYMESKTLAEKAALQFAKENPPFSVVSIVLPPVAGPSITSTAPLSVNMVLSLLIGNPQLYGSLLQYSRVWGNSVQLMHVQDVCNAHLFRMEHPAAKGHYLWCGHTGNPQSYGSLLQSSRVWGNSVQLMHVQDVCNAHLFLMEHPAAKGRYLCCGHTTTIPKLAHLISECYPQYTIKAKFDESVVAAYTFSSKKLSDLGFNYKYSLEGKKLGILD